MKPNLSKTNVKAGAAVIAACAACCAPLIAPPILALFAAGGAGLATSGEVWCLLALAAGFAAYILYRRHQMAKATRVSAACGCPSDGGCNTGTSCDLPDKST